MRELRADRGAGNRVTRFLKVHLHITLYTYFWFGLFVCGLVAPRDRVAVLETDLVSRGWHLSLISLFLILPVPILYLLRIARDARGRTGETGLEQ
ncbi:hypothetical protein ACFL4G_05325 [Thermodesulfobacteriota bacterium]